MLVLALDTTTRQGSAALARDGSAIAIYAGDTGIAHGARLPGDLTRVLDEHGLRLADVDLFAVGAGPGSFTGLRIGIATMQGLALANGKPLAGISVLDAIHDAISCPLSAVSSQFAALNSALSLQPSALSDEVAVWMDAQRGQVFSAVYRNGEVFEAALVDTPAGILARWALERTHPTVFAGDGAIAYRTLIGAAEAGAQIVEPVPPLAPSIARLAEVQWRQFGPAPPEAITPIYIRRSDVELARDRAAVSKP